MSFDLGERIKLARIMRDMTQDELAKAVGTTKQNIYKYENGIITNIPLDRVKLLGEALFIDPAWLMGWSNSMYKKDQFSKLIRARISAELSIIDPADIAAARESMNIEQLEQIVNGNGTISVDEAIEIADELGITLDDLLGIEEPTPVQNAERAEITAMFASLSDENQNKLLDYARVLLIAQTAEHGSPE